MEGGKGGRGLWTLGEGSRGGMGCGVNHDWCYCPQNPRIYLMGAVFSLTGYLGINFVLNSFGAVTAVTDESVHGTDRWLLGGAGVAGG